MSRPVRSERPVARQLRDFDVERNTDHACAADRVDASDTGAVVVDRADGPPFANRIPERETVTEADATADHEADGTSDADSDAQSVTGKLARDSRLADG